MEIQERILARYHKMALIKNLAAYIVSAVALICCAAILLMAPSSREIASNVVAFALLVFAVGLSGFTSFKAKIGDCKITSNKHRRE